MNAAPAAGHLRRRGAGGPTSPWYSDQTTMFFQKQWVTGRFCAADIAASPVKIVLHCI
ncbi:MAG: hypothetical protein ABI232_12325 [Jatrophihabitantaceae bacterium]